MTKQSGTREMQWSFSGNGGYRICGRTSDRLPPGAYTCTQDPYGNAIFYERPLLIDELVDYPGSLPAQILEELNLFWEMGDRFRKYGFRHRRGYLLYGKQGTGKSSLIHQLIALVVAQGNIAIYCQSPRTFVECVEEFRLVEPHRPLLCIFEDIDALVGTHGDSALLNWLDGNSQIDKAVNMATTNYPERLDRRLTARPRRFDRLVRIDPPDESFREAYFARKLPDLSAKERRRWVNVSKGLTFAALSELIISVCCLDKDLKESAALLKELDSRTPSAQEYEEEDDYEDEWQAETGSGLKRQRDKVDVPF